MPSSVLSFSVLIIKANPPQNFMQGQRIGLICLYTRVDYIFFFMLSTASTNGHCNCKNIKSVLLKDARALKSGFIFVTDG